MKQREKKNTIVLIGAIHLRHKPTCGETMKNQLFLKRFGELFEKVIPVDTYHWQKHPFCLIRLLFVLFCYPKAKVIISASGAAKYLIHFLYKCPINKHVYFWAVGGNLPLEIRKGSYQINALNRLVCILVQGRSMVTELNELGIKNAIYVPNSKPITFRPVITSHQYGQPYRFVFLSRIHPEKGIKEIAEAADMLEGDGYTGKFSIDFYGTLDQDYTLVFDSIINTKSSLTYRGYMDLTNNDGYRLLSSYDMTLFPTYWRGEGFPGVAIDANIAGLPIIASMWNLNAEVIEDGVTGILIPPHDSNALFTAMKTVIDGHIDLFNMRNNCVRYVQQYDFRSVLSEDLMRKINLYE